VVKLTILLVDLADFAIVNDIMASSFKTPYPARATCQVVALPKGGRIEVDGVLELGRVAEPTWPGGRSAISNKA
jgi:enamine deaminase RidA (YjgF/YER057c/UK114 family)